MTESQGFPPAGDGPGTVAATDVAGALAGLDHPSGVTPGTDLAVLDRAEIDRLLEPYTVSLGEWLRMLLVNSEYPEVEADEIGVGIIASILLATTSEEALKALDLQRAKTLAGGEPGGHSPVLEITGARALRSTFEDGPPCYAIVQATILATGERIQFTTGARAVQAAIVKHLGEGWLPFKGILTIRSQPTARGFHPLNLEFGG